MTRRSVWITRTRPGAGVTADRVAAAGMTPLVIPLLEVVFELGGEIDLTGVQALAFTSANGVRAFAARVVAHDLPVFAVGRGTAKAAREAGFAAVTASEGDVATLARAIPRRGLVLHPGAAEPAADLVFALERRGIAARGIVVYRTVAAELSEADLTTTAQADFVLLQSAKAARAFRDLPVDRPKPICVSRAVAEALSHAPFSSPPTPLSPARRDKDESPLPPLAGAATRAGARAIGGLRTREPIIAAAPTEDALIDALIQAAR